jgi:hypothetical protein
MRTVSRGELVSVLLWAAVVVVLAGLPYALAVSWEGPQRHFAGFLWGPDEGNVYLSYIRQASEGALVFTNQYTTSYQDPHFVNAFFLVLGWACQGLGLQPIQVFHLARLVGIPVALLAFYYLCAWLTAVRPVRMAAMVFASLSSGLGWVFVARAYAGAHPSFAPMDCASGWQAMPEAVTYLTFLLNPLFTWSLALLCAGLLLSWRALERWSYRHAVLAGLVLLALGSVHTYDVFPAYAAILIVALVVVRRRIVPYYGAVGICAVIVLISAPALAWAAWTAAVDPAWMAKAMTPKVSPRPADFFLGYGLLGLAALVGAKAAFQVRKVNWRSLAPVGWAAATFVLVYVPVSFQRKMTEGVHLALAYLAALAVALGLPALAERGWPEDLPDEARRARRKALALRLTVLFAAVTLPSNAVFVYDSLGHVAANNADLLRVLMPPAYLTTDEVAGLQWLAAEATSDDVVLSSSLMGSHIPAWAPPKVVVGHWDETIRFTEMLQVPYHFYAPGLIADIRADILRQNGVTYVWWGQYEQLMQQAMRGAAEAAIGAPVELPDPPDRDLPQLTVAFHHGTVTIYRVTRPMPGMGR